MNHKTQDEIITNTTSTITAATNKTHNAIKISGDRTVIEWLINGKCIRTFVFSNNNMDKQIQIDEYNDFVLLNNNSNYIIKAGFINFYDNQECFVIILSHFAYIYYLSKSLSSHYVFNKNNLSSTFSSINIKPSFTTINDSLIVNFPFPIDKAFWYSNGIVLQTLNNNSLQYKWITFTDPMSPFGNIQIDSNFITENLFNTYYYKNISPADMLHFPKNDDSNITVIFDKISSQLLFFYTKIRSSPNNTSSIHSTGTTTINQSNKRKMSFLKKRDDLLTDYHKNSSNFNQNSAPANNTVNKRNISATIDRMSSGINMTLSHTTDISKNMTNSSIHTDNGLPEDLIGDIPNQSHFQTKDVTLVQISTIVIPSIVNPSSMSLKCLSLFFDKKEMILVFDPMTKYIKIWCINMIPDVINSIQFKKYGNSPPNLITLEDLPVDDIFTKNTISNIIPLDIDMNENIKYSDIIHSTLIIKFDNKSFIFYNPFLKVYSPLFSKMNTHVSIITMFPQSSFMKSIFNALSLIIEQSMYYKLFYLWQYLYFNQDNNTDNIAEEFQIFTDILLALIYAKTDDSKIPTYITSLSLFQALVRNHDIQVILPKIIMGLHLISEELYLNILNKNKKIKLDEFLSNAIQLMNWPRPWKLYYKSKGHTDIFLHIKNKFPFAHPLDEPPSIMKSLYSIIENSQIPVTPFISFARLIETNDSTIDLLITPCCFKLLSLYEFIHSSKFNTIYNNEQQPSIMTILKKLNIDKLEIELYPLAIHNLIKKLLNEYEKNITSPNMGIDLSLIERPDIARSISLVGRKRYPRETRLDSNKQHGVINTSINRYGSSIHSSKIFISAAHNPPSYNQHPIAFKHNTDFTNITKPDDIYNVVSKIVKRTLSSEKLRKTKTISQTFARNNNKIFFINDKRFENVETMLNGSNIHKFNLITTESDYSKILLKKKLYTRFVALRTLISGLGRAALYYATEQPLTSQRCIIPELNLTTVFPDNTKMVAQVKTLVAGSNNNEMSDEELEIPKISSELAQWGNFHNGVSYALMISPKTKGINGSWITLNKPRNQLNATHGGFLLGMGLNGHLKSLEEWHVYNYLSPKETFTSIGLLLGMSASCKGTKNFKLIKVLAVHIVALLPKGSNDLNINLKVQNAGLVGMGLLYLGHKDKKINQSLIGELKSFVKVGEEFIADESYRIAVGIALGLNNLNTHNSDPFDQYDSDIDSNNSSLHDILSFNDEPYKSTKTNEYPYTKTAFFSSTNRSHTRVNDINPNSALVQDLLKLLNQHYDKEPFWLPGNSQIGAVIALICMFLRTENVDISSQIKLPIPTRDSTIYCKPELYMYREFCYFMINWSTIYDSIEFIMHDIDLSVTHNYDLPPIYYIMAGRVLAIGIKYASTGEIKVRNCLLSLLDRYLPFYQYVNTNMPVVTISKIYAITTLINALLISVSLVMCSTGDLMVFRRVKYLHEVITGRYSDIYSLNKDKKTKSTSKNETRQENSNQSNNNADVPEYETTGIANDIDPINNQSRNSDKEKDLDSHYGKYMVTSMCLGFLFLGCGQYALNTSTIESTVYIIISILPFLKSPYHLQELKYFWSMSVEPRCLFVKDVVTEKVIDGASVEITMKKSYSTDTMVKKSYTPYLLPDIRNIKKLKIEMNHYYPLEFVFNKEFPAVEFFQNNTTIYMQPKGENNEKICTPEDIKFGLKRRLNDADEGKNKKFNFASTLYKTLDISDLTLLELQSFLNNNDITDSESDKYDIEMLCTDKLSGNITNYQLQLWKTTQNNL